MPPVERLEIEEQPAKVRFKSILPSGPWVEAPPPSPSSLEKSVEMPTSTSTSTSESTKSDPRRLELMLKVVIQILSLRAILLMAMSGAFVLATRAMADQTPMALGVLGVYCVFAIVPIAYLEIRRNSESST